MGSQHPFSRLEPPVATTFIQDGWTLLIPGRSEDGDPQLLLDVAAEAGPKLVNPSLATGRSDTSEPCSREVMLPAPQAAGMLGAGPGPSRGRCRPRTPLFTHLWC